MKTQTSVFDDLQASLKEAAAIRKGTAKPSRVFRADTVDVKAVREKTKLSQADFALAINVSLRTLQNWEQHHRNPTGPAVALLKVVAREPEAAVRALQAA